MTHIIHPSPELNIKMGGTVSEVGVERAQREDSGLVARRTLYRR